MNKKHLILATAIYIAAVGCSKKSDSADVADKAKEPAIPTTLVTTKPATVGSIAKVIEVTGSLKALQDVVVGANQAGKLSRVLLHEGDPVTAGQVVAIMDLNEVQSQVLSSRANLQNAVARKEQAQVALLQSQNALTNATTTAKWTDKTTASAIDVAQSSVYSAEERLTVVKQGARVQERAQAEEQVKAAKANNDKAQSDVRRLRGLFREEAISQSQLEQAEATADASKANYNSAIQALSLVKEGARREDIRSAELAVKQAKDQLLRAQADRDQISLREQDVRTARVSVRSAESGVRSADAGIAQARASLSMTIDSQSKASITSPISGFVAERRAEPGQQIGAGGAVMRVVNPNSVYLEAALGESQYQEVHVGMHADVTIDAVPGEKLVGVVARILPVASSARSFNVRIDFATDKRMRPEMFARGSILINTHRGATLISKDSVIFDTVNNKTRIFLINGSVAEERIIKIGYMDPQQVEVVGGAVKSGDAVVVAGQNNLQDGDKIRTK